MATMSSLPLFDAVMQRDLERLVQLLEDGFDTEQVDEDGASALHCAATRGDTDAASKLIEYGCVVGTRDKWGWTPLHSAVHWRKPKMVSLLLDAGADPTVLTVGRETAFDLAITRELRLMLEAETTRRRRAAASHGGEVPVGKRPTLHQQVLGRKKEALQRLLARSDCDVNEVDEQGCTPLYLACKNGDVDLASVLLASAADANVTDSQGRTPLLVAVTNHDVALATALLSSGAHVNVSDDNARTPLSEAVQQGDLELTQLLISANADVNAKVSPEDIGHLHCASLAGHVDIVRCLLSASADVDALAENGLTPLARLMRCSSHDDDSNDDDDTDDSNDDDERRDKSSSDRLLSCVRALLEARASLDLVQDCDCDGIQKKGNTALHMAAVQGSADLVRLFLEHGADPKACNYVKSTPLHAASLAGSADCIGLLVAAGANINAIDEERIRVGEARHHDQSTPLHLAARSGSASAVRQLMVLHADINLCDRDYWTPLHWGADTGSLPIVESLVRKSSSSTFVNINAQTKDGSTPLHLAARAGSADVVALLLTHGAKVNARDVEGTTALHWATSGSFSNVAALLLSGKADPEAHDGWGWRAIHAAALQWTGQDTVMELLKAPVNATPSAITLEDETPLDIARNREMREVIRAGIQRRKLIKRNVRSVVKQLVCTVQRSFTPLPMRPTVHLHSDDNGHACVGDDDYYVDEDIGEDSVKSPLPLHIAVVSGGTTVVEAVLAAHTTDPYAVDTKGATALHIAATIGNTAVVELVKRAAPACVNTRDRNGHTPVHIACRAGHTDILRTLLSCDSMANRADVCGRDIDGSTPLHLAVGMGHAALVRVLVDADADVNISDNWGWTALRVAQETSNRACIKELQQFGAQ